MEANTFKHYNTECDSIDDLDINFNFIKETSIGKLNKLYKNKYAVCQLGLRDAPGNVFVVKIKKFLNNNMVLFYGGKSFSSRYIMNIFDTEKDANILWSIINVS